MTINCDSETFRVHKYFLCSSGWSKNLHGHRPRPARDLHLLGDGYNEAEDREGLLAQDSCVDNHKIGNCKLVVKTRYCGNKYVLCQVLLQVLHPDRWGMKKQRELFPGQIPYK